MQTAKVFQTGGSQAVRIPKEFRFEESEVLIKETKEGVLLISKHRHREAFWQEWIDNLEKFDEEITLDRGGLPQVREGLDEVFP